MTPTCPNPLKPEECEIINRTLEQIAATKELIAKCKLCQIPVEEYEEMNNRQEAILKNIKAQFFPHNA